MAANEITVQEIEVCVPMEILSQVQEAFNTLVKLSFPYGQDCPNIMAISLIIHTLKS